MERIVVFRALQLGDLLVAIPAFRALRHRFPHAEITLLGLPWAASFVQRFACYIDRFVEFVGYPGIVEVPVSARRTERFLTEQRAYRYDVALQMHGSGQTSNPFVLALGASVTVGYYEETLGGLTFGAPYPHDQHEIERNLTLVALLAHGTRTGEETMDANKNVLHRDVVTQGLYGNTTLEFPLFAGDYAEAEALLRSFRHGNRPLIGLHPGARPPARRWPAAYFANVADTLARRLDAQILLTGGPDEAETVQTVIDAMHTSALSLVGKTSLGGLAAVMGKLDLFISNDTGPSHVACAVDCPSITLFGPADVQRWAPLDRQKHSIARHPVACSPCGYWECPIDHRCLHGLLPQTVVAAALKQLRFDHVDSIL